VRKSKELLSRVVSGRRSFLLRRPIPVERYCRDGVWFCEYRPLKLLGYGETRRSSWESFAQDLSARWDLIAQEDDVRLAEDARAFKRRLRALVESVRPVH
jgi:hypothetical protein